MIEVELSGFKDIDRLLTKIAPNHAKNIMRTTIHSIAGRIRDDAMEEAREDDGVLKKSIKAKRERGKPDMVVSTVRVNERAFYWRFEEYGQGPDGIEVAMFTKAVAKFRADYRTIMREEFVKKFEAALARARRRQARGG